MEYVKKMNRYFAKNVMFGHALHLVGGVGLGIILSRPIADVHPVRFGLMFITLSVLGHVWAATQ